MEAKELRLGNIIMTKEGKQEKVYTLIDNAINGYYGNAGLLQDDETEFNGIEITEEWLINFDFKFENTKRFCEYFNEKRPNINTYIIDDIWFCSHFDWMCGKDNITSKRGWLVGRRDQNVRFCNNETWNYTESNEVKYVHELQNLFFALTGNELELKHKL